MAEHPFGISFDDDAYESFQNFVSQMNGYGVTVTTQEGEVIKGFLCGIDALSEWGDAILVEPIVDGDWEQKGDVRRVRVGDIRVH